ncbi:MAG: cobalamin-independent methionine synthase II family protein [Gammaproteobacteria bacterium]|nr:cobalamin-independent methionine synthase II family protein [Gammaproteobacteria bacterium]
METSTDRILTTHVGSLPRSRKVTEAVFAKENGELDDECALQETVKQAVQAVVRRQVEAGVDVVSDGEMSKISYATYIKDRMTGFAGDSPRKPPADLEEFPGFLERQARSGGTPSYKRPRCTGEIKVKDQEQLNRDIANFISALAADKPAEGFLTAASPGVIALFQPNEYYPDHESYLLALAEAMQVEYEAIVDSGCLLQLDAPDLGLGRHMMFKDRDDEEYVRLANLHVDILNHALRNIPAERMRLHVCWGNYEGPHHHDAPMEMVLPIALRARPQALLFEAANPRHAHEWEVFKKSHIPEDKVLVPGVIDSTTNFIEHPRLVAERICRFADIAGRERVIAGTDCGFSTFAGFGAVDEDIVYAKLAALAEGARLAGERLWRRSAA